ncbi:hypothetical protein CEXT_260251 [Caerostris extrusa]|uniref:Uncharacterized protein n=1 Tax=Caerostris extrusa TaxID=172846 RepID=A0AAV4PSB7_CAEEX|nr:hypothetical protein CEXT_260251 [Caerostris extrusa]
MGPDELTHARPSVPQVSVSQLAGRFLGCWPLKRQNFLNQHLPTRKLKTKQNKVLSREEKTPEKQKKRPQNDLPQNPPVREQNGLLNGGGPFQLLSGYKRGKGGRRFSELINTSLDPPFRLHCNLPLFFSHN